MQRHTFDPISFFFGLVFTAMAGAVLFVDDLDVFDARWVWPVVLIVGGVALLASMVTSRRYKAGPEPASIETADLPAADLAAAAAELPDEPHLS